MPSFLNVPDDPARSVWTVSELTDYIRQLFEIDFRLQELDVTGEISNFTRAASGHLYFTLKDEDAQIKCVMWRSQAERLRFRPGEGDAVQAAGRVSVYAASGQYQLYVDRLAPAGRGDLALAFEELKERLAAEGLFDAEFKQPIPQLPRRVGVVTSADAAALRDILNVLRRRNPLVSVLIAPTLVQGDQAPAQIVRALRWLDGRPDVDTIILARGGGSIEDLWAFNDEQVARAIFAATHPIISGVGHETDFTIADFVADLRAPTPSAAAELAVPNLAELQPYIVQLSERVKMLMTASLADSAESLKRQRQLLKLVSPRTKVDGDRQRVDGLASRLASASSRLMERRRTRLAVARASLAAISPHATLARGFSIVRRTDGQIVSRVADITGSDSITVQVSDGEFGATVNSP